MDAADPAEDGGWRGSVRPSGPRRSADRAFGTAELFVAYLELVGSRSTDPDEAKRVDGRPQAVPWRPLTESRAPRQHGLHALYPHVGARPVCLGKALARL